MLSINQSANHTIGDMIARETDPVTVARYNAKNAKYQVVCSGARGEHPDGSENVEPKSGKNNAGGN